MSMVRVSDATHQSLKDLADIRGVPMQAILEDAVETYRKRIFLEKLNEEFGVLKSNPVDWKDEQQERALWDQTLSDGLGSK